MSDSTYDIKKSYNDNYENGPTFNLSIPKRIRLKKPMRLWGYNLNSPVGIPAGPLLNSKYIKLYAQLGFDILVYKTVRTVERKAYTEPNCLLLDRYEQLNMKDIGKDIYAVSEINNRASKRISITNSFGIPSKPIEIWQEDIAKANEYLLHDQLMIVSSAGTETKHRSFIDDFVLCAQKAVEAGAKAIELNYSCPNVLSKEGGIYQDAKLSSIISKSVKKAIKDVPLMIKIGYIKDKKRANDVIISNAPFVDAIAAINTISMQIKDRRSKMQILPGIKRLSSGVCGNVIKSLSLDMTKFIHKVRKNNNFDFTLCGMGGVFSYEDIEDYLDAGADIVMSATGAMWNPFLAHQWQTKKFHQNFTENA